MSWGMFVDIYVKKDGKWTCKEVSKNFDTLKSLCDYRETLSEEISTAHLADEDKKVLQDFLEQNKWENHNYIDSLTPENFEKLDAPTHFEEWAGGQKGYVLNDVSDKKKVEELGLGEKILQVDRKSLYEIYYISKEERGYGKGDFYREGAFRDFLEKREIKLLDLLKQKFELTEKQNSLEYLKLSSEEKENVDESLNDKLSYLDEEIEEAQQECRAASAMAGILDFYCEFADDAVAYIFGE